MFLLRNITNNLVECVFGINLYNWLVENKVIDGNHLNMFWNIYDLKIYHMEASVVTDVIENI